MGNVVRIRSNAPPASERGTVTSDIPAISVKNVSRLYDDGAGNKKSALSIHELQVHPHELIAVIGPSGSGKSTLLQLVGGIDAPTGGSIEVSGHCISEMRESQRTVFRRKHIGFIFQAIHLVPSMTILENVGLSSIVSNKRSEHWKTQAMTLLDRLGLFDYAEKYPDQLSGGQRQRVAVGRAIFGKPSVLLADEPTGNLDSENRDIVLRLIREAVKGAHSTSGLMVTHDLHAASHADRVIAIRDGKILDQLELTNGGQHFGGQEGDSHHEERIRSWFAAISL